MSKSTSNFPATENANHCGNWVFIQRAIQANSACDLDPALSRFFALSAVPRLTSPAE